LTHLFIFFTSSDNRFLIFETLVRESGDICTFRIGIRSHAFNSDTLKTEHSSERNKMGSEIEPIYLDV
jgi:hypothetical protein